MIGRCSDMLIERLSDIERIYALEAEIGMGKIVYFDKNRRSFPKYIAILLETIYNISKTAWVWVDFGQLNKKSYHDAFLSSNPAMW